MFHNTNILILAGIYPERYTFSGKEKDPETGYSYFGARYYDPNYSIWTSVDPLSDKYPSITPYAYCANNPVMLVDPDGREIEDPNKYNVNIQNANAKSNYLQKKYGNKMNETYNVETYKGKKDVDYAKVTSTNNSTGEKNVASMFESDSQQGIGGYILNAINNYDIPQSNYDGANNAHEEPFLDNYVQPVLSGAVLLAPPVGIANSVKTMLTGTDIYNNKAENLDYVLSGIDIITLGMSSKVFKLSKVAKQNLNYIRNVSNVFSATRTGVIEYENKKK